MAYIDFMSSLHKSTSRDYLARVNDPEYPKGKAAHLAKQFDYDYWDGDRRICYGGYTYQPGRWKSVAESIINHYGILPGDRILDVGCGKGYQMQELRLACDGVEVTGVDISKYAVDNAHPDVKDSIHCCSAAQLPFEDNSFDLVISINAIHTLYCYDMYDALTEIERVGKDNKYLCVESWRNENEKANLLYWQVTCEAFCTPEEWEWWFKQTGYSGDHSFIFFE